MTTRPSVLFLTRSLGVGGSERQLVTLARELSRRGHRVEVAVFYTGGAFESVLRDAGITIHDLRKRSRWDLLGFTWRLARLLRRRRPAILHSYLVDANLLALTARVSCRTVRVVWGVRASFMDLERSSWVARTAFAISCRLARLAHIIVFNSHAGLSYHVDRGYPRDRSVVVHNGIDVDLWRPAPEKGAELRRAWGVSPATPLIGIVARIDPIKGHETFLRAAARMASERPDAIFVVAGTGDRQLTTRLQMLSVDLGIAARIIWAGGDQDPLAVYNALDVVTSASLGEGFPNVVAEAMSCARLCIGTDVGDTCELLGNRALCVPAGDNAALHRAWSQLLDGNASRWDAARLAARERILQHFSIESLAENTERVFRTLGAAGY